MGGLGPRHSVIGPAAHIPAMAHRAFLTGTDLDSTLDPPATGPHPRRPSGHG